MTGLHAAAALAVNLLVYLALPMAARPVAGLTLALTLAGGRWRREALTRGLMGASLVLPVGNSLAWFLAWCFGLAFQPVAMNEMVATLVVVLFPALAGGGGRGASMWMTWAAVVLTLGMYFTGWLGLAVGLAVWMGWRLRTAVPAAIHARLAVAGLVMLAAGVVGYQVWTVPNALGPRLEIWGVAWRMFAAAPVAGQGMGAFAEWWQAAYPAWPPYTHAHSLILQLLAETGLVGAGMALALAGGLVWWLWKRRANRWAVSALASTAAVGGMSLTDVPLSIGPVVGALAVAVWLGVRYEH